METIGQDAERSWVSRWRGDVLGVSVLLVLVARLTFGIAAVRDIPVDDEAFFASVGIRMLTALRAGIWRPGDPDWAPLHSTYYALLNVVCPARDRLFDVAWVVIVGYVVIAAYAVARAMSCSPLVATAMAGVLLATNLFHVQPLPSHVLAGLLLTGVLIAARTRSLLSAVTVLAVTFSCGAFLRPEMASVGILGLGVVLVMTVRGPDREWRRVLLPWAPAAVLAAAFGSPLGHGRAFLAFSQHFAFGIARREHLTDDPWMNYPRITARYFGDASSVTSALIRNPKALASHAAHNLIELPSNVLDLCSLRASVTAAPPPWLQGISAIFLGLAAVSLVASLRRSNRQVSHATRLVRVTFLAACVAIAPGVFLVFPRAHYFVVPCVFGWLLVTRGARLLLDRAVNKAPRLAWAIVIAGLVAIVPAASHAEPGLIPQRRAVTALRRLALRPGVVIDLTGGVVLFAGYDSPSIGEWLKDEPWLRFVDHRKIDTVFVWERFLAHRSFADDPEAMHFFAEPSSLDFREVYADPGYGRLLVRPHVLGEVDRDP
jgi:hypothetical protein